MQASKENLEKLMQSIALTQEHELDCTEVYDLMDIYAEAVNSGKDLTEVLPLVRQHLEVCKCCNEEIEALFRVLDQEEV